MKGKLIFEEKQTFIGTWSWYLILGIAVLSIVPMMVMLVINEDVETGLTSGGIAFLVMGAVITLYTIMRLEVSIDNDHIYYRFPPFVRSERMLKKGDVQQIYVRKYKPIWEYGGYGYRYRLRSGRAINVSGNHGLQIVLASGKKLLIGTQKPEEMEIAIQQLKKNWYGENHG